MRGWKVSMQNVFTRVLIKDKDNYLLIIQDRDNLWNFPGGKQETGETPYECATREVKEEIGINIHKLTEVYQGNFQFQSIRWQGYFYFAESVSGGTLQQAVREIRKSRNVEQ
jgi:8-oxo-dGTP diphosphatase